MYLYLWIELDEIYLRKNIKKNNAFYKRVQKLQKLAAPLKWRKVNRLIIVNILKQIEITLRTHGKKSNS